LKNKADKASEVLMRLKKRFPDARTELNYKTRFQLLVATVLSAQCTDVRVNKITPLLFKRYKNASEMARAKKTDVQKIIKSCGLSNTKSKNIVEASKILIDKYNGRIPGDRASLEKLPGVGRKTASILLAEIFNEPAFAVDTHIRRVTNRIGFVSTDNVRRIEDEMAGLLPPDELKGAHHLFILHGRRICAAKRPDCENCPINDLCTCFNSKKC